MAKIATGMYSKAMFDGIQRAEAMQAEAVLYIMEQFSVEDPDEIKLEELTLERLVTMLDRADKAGTRGELEAKLAELFMPAVQQILTMGGEQSA